MTQATISQFLALVRS